MAFKITYSVLNADLTELHREFDTALSQVKKNLVQELPSWIGGKAFSSGNFLEDRNPANVNELLAKFHTASVTKIIQ